MLIESDADDKKPPIVIAGLFGQMARRGAERVEG